MRFVSRLVRAKEVIEKHGFREVGLELAERWPGGPFYYCRFYLVRLRQAPTQNPRPLGPGVSLRLVESTPELIDRLTQTLALAREVIDFQIDGDHQHTRVILIEQEPARPVTVAFVRTTHVLRSPSGYTLDIRPLKATWGFGAYIAPSHRLKGYFPHLIHQACALARAEGTDGVYGEINYRNRPSLLAHARLGFEIFKDVHHLASFGRSLFREGHDREFWCLPGGVTLRRGIAMRRA